MDVVFEYDSTTESDVYYADCFFPDEKECAAVVVQRDARYRFYFTGCNDGGCECAGRGSWRVVVDFTLYGIEGRKL